MGSGARTANVLATDLNRDSLLDIVGINQGNGSLGVALGTSGGGLGSVTSYSTSTVGPYEAVAADFNGDGYPDLAAANFGASSGAPYGTTISIFINKGDGTFNSYVDVSATDSSTDKLRGIATGDFNSDGYADLAVAAQSTGLHILLGKGDGTFNPHVLYAAGSSVHGVVAADFNKDGKLDVALANNSTSGKVNVLLGNGNGTFNATTAYDAGAGTFALATGDLNGDGYPDIVTANNTDNSISVLINKGSTGTSASLFNTKVDYADSSATGAVGVSIGDLHNDGKLDVLSSNNTGAVTDVYKGNGDGTLQAASPLSTGSGSYGGRIADLNRDGMPDIAVALTGGSVSILRGSCL